MLLWALLEKKKNRLIACLSQSLHEVETIHHSSGWLSLQLIAISSTNAISSIINDNHERVDESLFPELPDRLQAHFWANKAFDRTSNTAAGGEGSLLCSFLCYLMRKINVLLGTRPARSSPPLFLPQLRLMCYELILFSFWLLTCSFFGVFIAMLNNMLLDKWITHSWCSWKLSYICLLW